MINFDNTYIHLSPDFYQRVNPTAALNPKLIVFNEELAKKLGFNIGQTSSDQLARFFSGKELIEGSEPLAMAYSGHQFGHFNPTLGDGRALLLGEVVSPQNERFDIQLKGSGVTPYSRGGDGRAALGPVLREYLVSTAMEALGIPTTKALAAVTSGDMIYRQEREVPGAIFTRVAASHIRIGTFEYFVSRQKIEQLQTLFEYTARRHYPDVLSSDQPVLNFFQVYSDRFLKLVAQWMGVGFIHGVMNTDNTALSGETIDYGPCAFMDHYHSQQVFSSIDRDGRYRYDHQGTIACWNLSVLANCLLPLIPGDSKLAVTQMQDQLDQLMGRFEKHWLQIQAQKLGISEPKTTDKEIIQSWLQHLEQEKLDYTGSYLDLSNQLADIKDTNPFIERLRARHQEQEPQLAAMLMSEANPLYIPRNHIVEQVIQSAYGGDFAPFHQFLDILKQPFNLRPGTESYQSPPAPHEQVFKTYCGT